MQGSCVAIVSYQVCRFLTEYAKCSTLWQSAEGRARASQGMLAA